LGQTRRHLMPLQASLHRLMCDACLLAQRLLLQYRGCLLVC
jgi:hypothetical protein